MTQIRVGIIGCGGIAHDHLVGFKAQGITPVALTDPIRESAERMAEQCSGAKIYDDAISLIESGEVNAISICSPPAYHEEAAIPALEKNIHVLCEKPLAHTPESGYRMAEAAKQSKALFMVAYRHRFFPAILKIRELIQEGTVGPITLFHNSFCGYAPDMNKKWFSKKSIAGGGSMLDAGSHSVDLFRFLVGEVTKQQGVFNRRMEDCDVEDTGIIALQAENGTPGTLSSSWLSGPFIGTIDVIGPEGRIFFDYGKGDQISLTLRSGKDEIIPVPSSSGFQEEIAHFVAAIEGRETLSCTATDGLRALEIIFSCYNSD